MIYRVLAAAVAILRLVCGVPPFRSVEKRSDFRFCPLATASSLQPPESLADHLNHEATLNTLQVAYIALPIAGSVSRGDHRNIDSSTAATASLRRRRSIRAISS